MQSRHRDTKRTNVWTPQGKTGWDELGDYDWHIHTAMYKIETRIIRTYCIDRGTLLNALQ